MLSLLYLVVRSVLRFIVWSLRSRHAQALEVMVLRHSRDMYLEILKALGQATALNRPVAPSMSLSHDVDVSRRGGRSPRSCVDHPRD